MADETFDGLAIAVEAQTVFGTPIDMSALGNGDLSDGYVLGDKNSGDAESGITTPSLSAIVREVAAVAASFTESADAFLRLAADGFSITFPMQGNGGTSTPTPGEADLATLAPGYEALYESIGLIGATGGSGCEHDYTPRIGASSPTVRYLTIKMFHGDLSIQLDDCIVDSASMVFTPGGNGLCTANIKVGSIPTANIVDGVTFPTIDYEEMADNAAPVVEGVSFAAFGQTRGFENLTINIAQDVEEFGDSNVDDTGIRQVVTGRRFTVDGTLYVNTSDSAAESDNLVLTTAPTADLSFQVGTVATAGLTMLAYNIECRNLQSRSIKYNRIGDVLAVEMSGAKCTGLTAGSEFQLTFN
jgi:hypothetical protein